MSATHAVADAPLLSWIVPMYRTAESLPELLRRMDETAARLPLASEFVLVDDACPQRSGEQALALPPPRAPLRVLRLPQNLGQNGALREGLRHCTGQWAVLLDADLQDPPEAVADLWQARADELDAVFARRVGRYEGAGRLFTSRLYRRAVEWIGGLPPGACLYVLLRRPMIDAVVATRRVPISLLAVMAAAGRRFGSVAVQREKRRIGRSAYSSLARLRVALRSLWQMALARRLHRPL